MAHHLGGLEKRGHGLGSSIAPYILTGIFNRTLLSVKYAFLEPF